MKNETLNRKHDIRLSNLIDKLSVLLVSIFFPLNIFDKMLLGKRLTIDYLILGIVLVLVIFNSIVLKRNLSIGLSVILPILILLIPTSIINPIDSFKLARIIIYTFSFTLIGVNLFNIKENILLFMKLLALWGFILALLSIGLGQKAQDNRLSLFGSNPIWLSREIGITVIYLYLLYLTNKISIFQFLLFSIIPIFAMIRTLSLGPMISLFLCLIILTFIFDVRNKNFRLFYVIPIIIVVLIIMFRFLPKELLSRYIGNSESNLSRNYRMQMYVLCINLISKYPLGIGIGQFYRYSPYYFLTYPHNIILEALVEGGWLFGTYIIYTIFSSLRYFYKNIFSDYSLLYVFSIFSFSVLNSMVSGDLLSTKLIFFCLGVYCAKKYGLKIVIR
ncbi:O-antigen ligase family protein [Microaceticoccus formicicus]|uniref:O-antigen ligase family protein n=1 Tax=Microaceticoccus formicicus TaxID=3118105 RepID=UPI003CD01389|nr:O-antigen ligase family protein [Peptoniphilaceae bacterium AMB_02]